MASGLNCLARSPYLHFPQVSVACSLAPAVQLWFSSRAVPQPSALAPRGVDWFVFPSVTLRNPEKLKCESFMLHERRGRQASQLGKKHWVCFISKADGETFRALLAAGDIDLGFFKKEQGRRKCEFSICYKILSFHVSRWILERSFPPVLLSVHTRLSMSFSCLQWGVKDGVCLLCD